MNVHSASPKTVNPVVKTISEEKYQRILSAALRVFAESGVDGTAVPAIAVEAGVGVGTLYRYFENKAALVNALYRHTKNQLGIRLTEGIDVDQPPKTLFDAFWQRLVDFATDEPRAFEFLELQDHLPYLDDESRAVEIEVLAPIWQTFVELQHGGTIRTGLRPEVAIALIWGAFVGLFKAKRNAYLELSNDDLAAARDSCWHALTFSAGDPAKGRP